MEETRVGIGYDVHRLVTGRPLVLGGVTIPAERGLEGHSDADVVIHAIMDALLGAAALGDIGQHFPPGDPAFKDIDSRQLLSRVRGVLDRARWRVVNVDCTIVAECPKLTPHMGAMRAALAAALDVEGERIGLKATTNEGIGFIGREEGIAALAVAFLARSR